MTKKETNKPSAETAETFNKLSIQVSLNGLSFCVADTISKKVLLQVKRNFGKELSPYEVQKELQDLMRENRVSDFGITETVVVHANKLFSLVPKPLFKKDELANYLKFNVKILANDFIDYDQIEGHELVNVYIPYVNINNYIFDLFGAFEFKHNATVLLESLLKSQVNGSGPVCYIHNTDRQMYVLVADRKKLLFYNSFDYQTKEDFIYYLLFTLEQLKLDPEQVSLRLFGQIEEGDALYKICYEFVRHISIFVPDYNYQPADEQSTAEMDYTVLSAL